MMKARRTVLWGATAVAAVATATAVPAPAMAGEARPAVSHTTALEKCQGVTVDRTAPVIARASVLIKASVHEIWDLHTDIDAWDTWIPEITPAQKKTPGPLRPGSVFDWSPQGMQVTSTVTTIQRNRCTAWAAPVNGIDGVHLFTFKKVRGGVLATTEESWAGAPVEADVPGNQAALETGLVDWVNRLKTTAEADSDCAGYEGRYR
ncbi:SRPBCC family protein [Streptomyces olivaceus]|uniref:SRPBCC family protein n=1 Tax=Streptomyces olivaceus TaxID=47716 RepID=UPI0018857353|nr:SRPBCC family protein [Streptomyces olivaceus]